MSDLLLEVGVEEIPARMVPDARADLERRFVDALKEAGLADGVRLVIEATPRRLALFAENIASRQADRVELLKGPPRRIAFDGDGQPTRAALGFARKCGVPVEALQTGSEGKLVVERRTAGRGARELLAESLPRVVVGMRFPRSMYWTGRGGPRFIRPIRWLLALLDGEVVPFEIAGVAAGAQTWGHRRLGAGPIAVRDANEYRSALEANAVLLSAAERSRKIGDEAAALLPPGCRVRTADRLRRTLTYETEWPVAILGTFDPGYLELPEEVLQTVMLVHQKYFSVEDEAGRLTNCFVAVANARDDASGLIRRGHERVLRARFNDARFFWKFDQRSSLADRVDDLKQVLFQGSLGSYWDKTEANQRAVADLADALGLDAEAAACAARAALLAKSDLTTEMVGEFPELQGKIGGLYAAAQGEPQAVADAIYDHYLPVGAEGPLPRSQAARIVALADRLATLGGMFRVGLAPTSSKDPLALRPAAFGAMRIVIEGELPLTLDCLVGVAHAGDNAPQLREFLLARLRYWLERKEGLANDEIQAVCAASDAEPGDVVVRARALDAVRRTPDFEALAASFKRIRNILAQAGGVGSFAGAAVDPALLETGAEADLHAALEGVAGQLTCLVGRRDYEVALRRIAALRPALDRYFDDVLVMADDGAVRRNRLVFLAGLLQRLSTIADFAAIAPSLADATAATDKVTIKLVRKHRGAGPAE